MRRPWSPGPVEEAEPGTWARREVPAPRAREGSAMQEGLFLVFLSEIPAQHV